MAAMIDRGPGDDDPERALRSVRDRFIREFPARCASLALLGDAVAELGAAGPADALRRLTHQMAGLAGTIGFPTVSARSTDLEQLLLAASTLSVDRATFREAVDGLQRAFDEDLARPQPSWALPAPGLPEGPLLLIVEDDEAQRTAVTAVLHAAGYRVVAEGDGAAALDRARHDRPDAILLDVNLPGLDGFAVCRTLKASPELSSIPVAFMTTRTGIDDRLLGLTLGADEYLCKPVDARELVQRLQRLLRRPADAGGGGGRRGTGTLSYEAFSVAAGDLLSRHGGSLTLVRIQRGDPDTVAAWLLDNVRRRDLVGRYDPRHVIVLLPDVSPAIARERMRDAAQALERDGCRIVSGIAGAAGPGTALEDLLAEADEALNEARYRGEAASLKSEHTRGAPAPRATVLIAEDDPDVIRIVDAQMRAAGYETILVFDGAAAARTALERSPDVILLDLMMPKQTGFDVLRTLGARPGARMRTIVLSARGREDDVTRAFELGADDYVVKPFSPQELLARVARLLK